MLPYVLRGSAAMCVIKLGSSCELLPVFLGIPFPQIKVNTPRSLIMKMARTYRLSSTGYLFYGVGGVLVVMGKDSSTQEELGPTKGMFRSHNIITL